MSEKVPPTAGRSQSSSLIGSSSADVGGTSVRVDTARQLRRATTNPYQMAVQQASTVKKKEEQDFAGAAPFSGKTLPDIQVTTIITIIS